MWEDAQVRCCVGIWVVSCHFAWGVCSDWFLGVGQGQHAAASPSCIALLAVGLLMFALLLTCLSGRCSWCCTGEALANVAATRNAAYTAWRTYYAAHAALAAGDERLAEAAGLFGRAQQRAAEAVEGIQVRKGCRVWRVLLDAVGVLSMSVQDSVAKLVLNGKLWFGCHACMMPVWEGFGHLPA